VHPILAMIIPAYRCSFRCSAFYFATHFTTDYLGGPGAAVGPVGERVRVCIG